MIWSSHVRIAVLLTLSVSFLTACSKDDKDEKKDGKFAPSNGLHFVQENVRILKVVDLAGQPIAKAQVLIGQGLDQPFGNNFVETDSQGHLNAPFGWTETATVTISAPGYVRASYLQQRPQGQTFTLRRQEKDRNLELAGKTTGFHVVNNDGKLDFGLVIPALSKQDLFAFDQGMVISTQNDVITVAGKKISVPSNITLPTQRETYVLPLTFNKPDYRMYFSTPGTKKVFTAAGQFPLKKVVDELRAGKPFFELINYFNITGGSLKEVAINGEKTSADLPVTELSFTETRSFQAPAFPSDQVLLALALSDDRSSLFPTDLKNATANQATMLKTAAGSTPLLLSVLKNKSETKGEGVDRLSATLVPFVDGVAPENLPLMKSPEVLAANHIHTDVVTPIAGVTPIATYALLSSVDTRTVDQVQVETLLRTWEVYSPDWSEDIQLPAWPGETPLAGKKRWEVSKVGSLEGAKSVDLGPGLFESVTHATHASTDF